jgi:hypothetical protein
VTIKVTARWGRGLRDILTKEGGLASRVGTLWDSGQEAEEGSSWKVRLGRFVSAVSSWRPPSVCSDKSRCPSACYGRERQAYRGNPLSAHGQKRQGENSCVC